MAVENISEGAFTYVLMMLGFCFAYQVVLELVAIQFVYKDEEYQSLVAKVHKLGGEIQATQEKILYGTYTPQKKQGFAKFMET